MAIALSNMEFQTSKMSGKPLEKKNLTFGPPVEDVSGTSYLSVGMTQEIHESPSPVTSQ
jgi:hypothetical protein